MWGGEVSTEVVGTHDFIIAGAMAPPGPGPRKSVGAMAPPGPGPKKSAGAMAPPGPGPKSFAGALAPPGPGRKKKAGAGPGPRQTLEIFLKTIFRHGHIRARLSKFNLKIRPFLVNLTSVLCDKVVVS